MAAGSLKVAGHLGCDGVAGQEFGVDRGNMNVPRVGSGDSHDFSRPSGEDHGHAVVDVDGFVRFWS